MKDKILVLAKSIIGLISGTDNDSLAFTINDIEKVKENALQIIIELEHPLTPITDEAIHAELKNYFKKLTLELTDFEEFRIETAFEYAAKWASSHPSDNIPITDEAMEKELTYLIAGNCINDLAAKNAVDAIMEWYKTLQK